MVYNTRYDEDHWKGLCDQAGPMCDIIKFAKALGLDLPPPCNDYKEACPSYRIKGLYTARFRRSVDHFPYQSGGGPGTDGVGKMTPPLRAGPWERRECK